MKLRSLAPVAILSVLSAGCALAPADDTSGGHGVTTAAPEEAEIHEALPGLLTAGQPAPSQWAELEARGVTTVINLRTADEMKIEGRDEVAETQAEGLAYDAVAVAGVAEITLAKADEVLALVDAAPGATLVHCSAGSRSASIVALIAWRRGMSVDEAIAVGKAAGMTGTEDRVRAILEAESAR